MLKVCVASASTVSGWFVSRGSWLVLLFSCPKTLPRTWAENMDKFYILSHFLLMSCPRSLLLKSTELLVLLEPRALYLLTESRCKFPLCNRATSPSSRTFCLSYCRVWCWLYQPRPSPSGTGSDSGSLLVSQPCLFIATTSGSIFSNCFVSALKPNSSFVVQFCSINGGLGHFEAHCLWQLMDIWCLMNQHTSFCIFSSIHFLFITHFSPRLCHL